MGSRRSTSRPKMGTVPCCNELFIEELIAARCNVELQEKNGYTPLHIAADKGREAVMEQLIAARYTLVA